MNARIREWLAGALGMSIILAPEMAFGQTSTDVAAEAEDAFGTRIGLERIGLYSESQVRGFSLADAANYRFDGVYVAPLAMPTNPILSGVTTRVGWNALSADFPAPSGIVDYSITSPPAGTHSYIEAGVLDRWSPYLFGTGSTRTEDGKWALGGGFQIQPRSRRVDGELAQQVAFGAVAEWRPIDGASIQLFASGSDYESPGDWGFVATESVLPPKPDYPNDYTAVGSHFDIEQQSFGVIARFKSHDWDFHTGIFYSAIDLNPVDVTLSALDGAGEGRAIGIFSHRGTADALSGEFKASRRIGAGNRVFAAIRGRRTVYHTPRASVVDLGPANITDGVPDTPPPPFADALITDDEVEQLDFAIGAESRIFSWLLIRGGLHKAAYEKTVSPPDAEATRTTADPWLFDAAAIFALSDSATLFATYTKGLEESGSAPATATNRFAALPAVIAVQRELGVRAQLASEFSFIGSIFEVKKPAPGFDASGAFRVVNNERHRGIELSLTGRVASGLNAVIGAVVLDPTISGETVESGLSANEPVGVSRVLAVGSLSYEVPQLPGLSIDAHVSYNGKRLVHADGNLEAPGFTVANAGARYSFKIGNRSADIRLLVSNVLDERAWQASNSEVLGLTAPRSMRLTFAIRN